MANDRISYEEAQEYIKQRMEEAETYSLQQRLGFGDSRSARWILLLTVASAIIVGLLI